MSRETTLEDYRDTNEAEQRIEEIGEERVMDMLEDADVIDTTSNYFASYHDGSIGCVIRLTESPVLERVYAADLPNPHLFELSDHAIRRAKERGFYDEEVIELAKTGVYAWDEHDDEQGILAFNRMNDQTILIPMNPSGRIKSVFSRQGINGKLRVNGAEVDRVTRNYRERKKRDDTKYTT